MGSESGQEVTLRVFPSPKVTHRQQYGMGTLPSNGLSSHTLLLGIFHNKHGRLLPLWYIHAHILTHVEEHMQVLSLSFTHTRWCTLTPYIQTHCSETHIGIAISSKLEN